MPASRCKVQAVDKATLEGRAVEIIGSTVGDAPSRFHVEVMRPQDLVRRLP